MDTVPSLQEQINDLQKRVEVLEKQKRKRAWTKNPPLTPEEVKKAETQLLILLINLPRDQMLKPRDLAQRTALLRRLGAVKVREHLEARAAQGDFIKQGNGTSARYAFKV